MASAAADPAAIDAANAAAVDARAKKPVWNVPSNGSMSVEVEPVMGAADFWPALSESTKPIYKSSPSSSESLKSLLPPEGTLVSSPKATAVATTSNPNPIPNPTPHLNRQKSNKNRSNGGFAPPPPMTLEVPRNALERPAFPEPSPRGSKSGYNGNRKGGPHQGHGNRDWNNHHHPRGGHVLQPRGVRPFPRAMHMQPPPPPPPPASPPFTGPPPPPPLVRPFVGNAMSFPDMPSPLYFVSPPPPPPESMRGVSFVPQPMPPHHGMFFPQMDQQRAQLLKQIDYYFSSENLCKDVFLRQNMDDQGWVPVTLIAGFNRVKLLTNNIPYILDTVQFSSIVELQGDKIRRRNDWMNWLLLPTNQIGPQSPTAADHDGLATRMQTVSLEGATSNHNRVEAVHGEALTRSLSGVLKNQHQIVGEPSVDGQGQFAGLTESDRSQRTGSLSKSGSF